MPSRPLLHVVAILLACAAPACDAGARSSENLARELNTARRTIERLERENRILRSCASTACVERVSELEERRSAASGAGGGRAATAKESRNMQKGKPAAVRKATAAAPPSHVAPAPTKYEALGEGICTAGGSFFVETCVYSNIATPSACEEACTQDDGCQAFAVSKAHTECNHWTSSACARGGEKFNEGSAGLLIDGVATNDQYLQCQRKVGFRRGHRGL